MKKLIIHILFAFTYLSTTANSFEIIYPLQKQVLCSDSPVVLKWSGDIHNPEIRVLAENDTNFRKIINYEVSNNFFIWFVNDNDLLNVPLIFKIFDNDNPDVFVLSSEFVVNEESIITNQTSSLQLCENEDAFLQIEAQGYNLRYQWYKDGSLLKGENSSVLRFTEIQYRQSGVYTCLLSSDSNCDSVISKPISVYVVTKTKFVQNPNNVQYAIYESVKDEKTTGRMTAKIHVNNIEELENIKFQWWKDTIALKPIVGGGGYLRLNGFTKRIKVVDDGRITGSTSQILQIRDMVWGDRSNYYCEATGLCGSDITRCYIGENTHFYIENNFNSWDGCQGEDVTLKVSVQQYVSGRLSYQWYKVGNVKLLESDKLIGTQTPELTIKNTDAILDSDVYYCRITLIDHNITQHSDEFYIQPSTLPIIAYQPKDYVITEKTNKYYGQTYVDVFVRNAPGCEFTWYRNGVQARIPCWKSDYWLGKDSCPPISGYPPTPPRPAVKEDVGWYVCKIENKCGIVWSDSVYVTWGYNDVIHCVGEDAELIVDELDSNYYYQWVKNNAILNNSAKYFGTNSNKLRIFDVKSEDEGNYNCIAVNKSDSSKYDFAKVLLEVRKAPFILKEFPEEIVNNGLEMRNVAVTVSSKGERLYYRLYIDDEPAEPLKEIINKNHWATTYPFYLGGYNSNLKTGRYKYYFKNDCGEIWSKEMKIINTAYKPKGSPAPEDSLISYTPFDNDTHKLIIFPNPTSDFITITLSNKGLQPFATTDKVQIFDILGIEIKDLTPALSKGEGVRIDVSKLPAGVYFIRIGDKVEKFVKM